MRPSKKNAPAKPSLIFFKKATDYLEKLYEDISGFTLFEGIENTTDQHIFSTYGEIKSNSVNELAKILKISTRDVFFDFGSGVGKTVLQLFMTTPLKGAYGVEVSKGRNDAAINVLKKVQKRYPDLWAPNRKIQFFENNLLDINIEQATVIYTCSTCFDDDLLEKIGTLAMHALKLRYLISLKAIPACPLPLQHILDIQCSWTDSTNCHIYGKKPLSGIKNTPFEIS